MKFWKNNSYDIVRLFIYQCGMAIFGTIVTMALLKLEQYQIFASVFAVGFYLVLIYSVMWETGSKDRIRIDAGRLPMRRLHGLSLMLFAQIPNFILSALMILGGALFFGGITVVGARLFGVPQIISSFLGAPYLGIIREYTAAFSGAASEYLVSGVAYLLTSIPGIAVSTFAYFMGVTNRRLIPAKKPESKG